MLTKHSRNLEPGFEERIINHATSERVRLTAPVLRLPPYAWAIAIVNTEPIIIMVKEPYLRHQRHLKARRKIEQPAPPCSLKPRMARLSPICCCCSKVRRPGSMLLEPVEGARSTVPMAEKAVPAALDAPEMDTKVEPTSSAMVSGIPSTGRNVVVVVVVV